MQTKNQEYFAFDRIFEEAEQAENLRIETALYIESEPIAQELRSHFVYRRTPKRFICAEWIARKKKSLKSRKT